MTTPLERYQASLMSIPPSGGGGCHVALLGIARRGILAGVSPEQVHRDLRSNVRGTRKVPDREIAAAVRKAAGEGARRSYVPRYATIVCSDARQRIVASGKGISEADIWERSPVRIDWPPEEDAWRMVENLFAPDEYYFIGTDQTPGAMGESIRQASQWCRYFRCIGWSPYPKIVPNPLTGNPGRTKDGKLSYRADACVADFRYIVCEFDNIPLSDQLAFWFAAKLPVAALIHSGNKSLHAWVRVDCQDAREWEEDVESKLFPMVLVPLGMDSACKNESRLSRMPGHIRHDTKLAQKLLYLAPGGRAISA